jgi:hypothetical protein
VLLEIGTLAHVFKDIQYQSKVWTPTHSRVFLYFSLFFAIYSPSAFPLIKLFHCTHVEEVGNCKKKKTENHNQSYRHVGCLATKQMCTQLWGKTDGVDNM